MKKMTFVAIIAVAFMLVAATAMAIGPAYVDWSAGSAANSGTGGPHSNYQLTTEKCAVCHSVHAAASAGAAAGVFGPEAIGAAQPEMLLRSTVADACTYCHITNWSTSGIGIYAGVASNYNTFNDFGHQAEAFPGDTAKCSNCHAVHGADTFGGQALEKILKNGTTPGTGTNQSFELQTQAVAGLGAAGAAATGTNEDAQVTAFCTRCHKTYSTNSYQAVTATGYFEEYDGTAGSGTYTYKNHPLKAFGATFAAQGATYLGQVAWADSTYCRSCHAAGADDVSTASGGTGGLVISSFPHYTPNKASFLVAGYGSGDTGIGADSSAAAAGYTVTNAGEDGVCLRCHTNGTGSTPPNSNGTAGVGITF